MSAQQTGAVASAVGTLAMLAPSSRHLMGAEQRAVLAAIELELLAEHAERVDLALALITDVHDPADHLWALDMAGVDDLDTLRATPEHLTRLRTRLRLLLAIAARESRQTPADVLRDLARARSERARFRLALSWRIARDRTRALTLATVTHRARPRPCEAPPLLLDYLARVLPDRAPPRLRVVI